MIAANLSYDQKTEGRFPKLKALNHDVDWTLDRFLLIGNC